MTLLLEASPSPTKYHMSLLVRIAQHAHHTRGRRLLIKLHRLGVPGSELEDRAGLQNVDSKVKGSVDA